jgi:periplasmic divalent cation tolerance protein
MLLVLSTFATKLEAQRIAKTLLAKKLIACANIVRCDSLYAWKGKMKSHPEHIALMKTTDSNFPKLEKAIKAMHSYKVPEVMAIKISKASPAYSKWVSSCTSKSTK